MFSIGFSKVFCVFNGFSLGFLRQELRATALRVG